MVILQVYAEPKRDVHIVGKNMSTENVEEVWKQNVVIVEEPIMWHMEGVK